MSARFERLLLDHEIAHQDMIRHKRKGDLVQAAYDKGRRDEIGQVLDAMRDGRL